MKKILLIPSNITTDNMVPYLQDLGYEVVIWRVPKEAEEQEYAELLYDILDESYYAIFMYNYISQIAQVCYDKNRYYITWIVDNPHFSLESKTAYYPTNRIFSFDKNQSENLHKRGVSNVFHLPLGADVEGLQSVAGSDSRFRADVSFVGDLYNGERNLFQQITYLPPYTKGYLNGLIQAQQKLGENIIVKEMVSEQIWKDLKTYVILEGIEEYEASYEDQLIHMLQKEVTRRERCNTVSLLNHIFDFKIYTGSSTAFDEHLCSEGYVDYKTQMPMIFRQSKVNMNITLRSITSGIPLRALDIMACGGFLLSNYQKELCEYFQEDKECVFYYSMEDMVDKIAYYLSHEEERNCIAQAGYQKVKNEFSLKVQLEKMKVLLEENE